ncbi:major facilitator superfamily transporter [Trichoderma arundinaceum]|uniref:Major facilitator superfamily transporter n=1 Tax=Trichoderma arundinaceum TaxID=490622 RepID=A0A395N6V1_TRIAR|nr:major facilitator superfamily transporter [Trichoderma arundinaceum]RFU71842.1 major facilitator superfamily transporter [Trichoderma arundinaceum]
MHTSVDDTDRDTDVSEAIMSNSSPRHNSSQLPTNEKDVERDAETSMSAKQHFPETDLDRGVIGWDDQDDSQNPQNFSSGHKWGLLALMAGITFVSPLASSMVSPAIEYVGADFGVTDEILLSLTVSIYLLGYAFGPLLFAPLSEIYGRRIVLSGANWFFVVWQIGCATAPNIACLIVFRLFAGIGGSGCMTLGAGVIADLFPVEQRGLATSFWSMGPLLGPVVGPICGGFIGETVGWRWVFWVLLIVGSVMSIGIEILNRETYAPVLIHWKTERLSKELGRTDLRSAYNKEGTEKSVLTTLKVGLMRPILLFCKSPIVFLLSVYLALVYGLLYLFFTTIPSVFKDKYGFSTGLVGLVYLGIGLGFIAGLVLTALTNDRIMTAMARRNGGKFEPEMRLPMMIFYATFCPISFFWYGWTADKDVHWIVPIIGMIPFGFGLMGLYLPIQTYIIDSYPNYAASGSAALVASRSLLGALLPLAGPKLFATLGLGWGNSLLGFISLACWKP